MRALHCGSDKIIKYSQLKEYYDKSKKKNCRCILNIRAKRTDGTLQKPNSDHSASHRANSPAIYHFEPNNHENICGDQINNTNEGKKAISDSVITLQASSGQGIVLTS